MEDVQEEGGDSPSSYEAGIIFSVSLLLLIGMILSFVSRANVEVKHNTPRQGSPPPTDQPIVHDSVDDLIGSGLR